MLNDGEITKIPFNKFATPARIGVFGLNPTQSSKREPSDAVAMHSDCISINSFQPHDPKRLQVLLYSPSAGWADHFLD